MKRPGDSSRSRWRRYVGNRPMIQDEVSRVEDFDPCETSQRWFTTALPPSGSSNAGSRLEQWCSGRFYLSFLLDFDDPRRIAHASRNPLHPLRHQRRLIRGKWNVDFPPVTFPGDCRKLRIWSGNAPPIEVIVAFSLRYLFSGCAQPVLEESLSFVWPHIVINRADGHWAQR